MEVIKVRNVHEALPECLHRLENLGQSMNSRNGEVIVFPTPVTTIYEKPNERVMFWEARDCNPFFHLMEALWMLAGRNDVKFVSYYVSRMKEFSDDGKTFNAAYGHRWRKEYSFDQLGHIIAMLKKNPEDRRAVLQIWDANLDLTYNGKDAACNTHAYFRIIDGKLDMTVCNRSNDIVWGAYGANAVHFSILQEYMAAGIGCEIGRYYQVSNNLHAYTTTLESVKHLADSAADGHKRLFNPYENFDSLFPMVSTDIGEWQQDLMMYLEEGVVLGLRDKFFRRVVHPINMAYKAYKENKGEEKYSIPIEILDNCEAVDWKLACEQWITRRYNKWLNQ